MSEHPSTSPASRPSVLIVDDEVTFLDMLRETLALDFEVVTKTTTKAAEQAMTERAFDVVVSDYLMPGEMGLEFLVRSAQRWPQTRRIMLTGYINPELLSRSITLAALSACLLKPVRPAELAQAIREALQAESTGATNAGVIFTP